MDGWSLLHLLINNYDKKIHIPKLKRFEYQDVLEGFVCIFSDTIYDGKICDYLFAKCGYDFDENADLYTCLLSLILSSLNNPEVREHQANFFL